MPLGVPAPGSAAVILIGTTAVPATPVGGLLTWNYVGDAPTTDRNYYGQASAVAAGKKTRSIAFSLDYETADSGQLILFAAFVSQATIWAKLMPDGTNGETLPSKVTHQEIAGPDANQFTTANFTLSQQTDPTVVAGGFGT